MVVKYGMSDKIGPLSFSSENDEVFLGRDYGHTRHYSEQLAGQIDEEIRAIVEAAYKRCEEILSGHLGTLHEIAVYLLEFETMDAETFAGYFE